MSKVHIPTEILRVFKEYYPDVSLGEVKWSWEIPGKIYEAVFEQYDVKYEVEITVTGHLLLSEIEMGIEDVPEYILEAAKKEFKGFEITAATMVQYSNGDLSYELELENKKTGKSFEAHFRDDGMFLIKRADL